MKPTREQIAALKNAAAILGMIRCVVGKEGTEDSVLEAVQALRKRAEDAEATVSVLKMALELNKEECQHWAGKYAESEAQLAGMKQAESQRAWDCGICCGPTDPEFCGVGQCHGFRP